MELTNLGKLVKIKLIEQGKSLTTLAKELDTSVQNLSAVLRGQPSANIEEKLYSYLGLKIKKKGEKKND